MTRTTEPRDAQIEQDRAMEATDDRGMEMLAKVFAFGAAMAFVLGTSYAVWVVFGGAQ